MAQRVFTQTFGVVGGLIEKNGMFLLVKENKAGLDTGKWNIPAGWIEVGEDPILAGKREIEEESGYEFTAKSILGVYSNLRKDLIKKGGQTIHAIKIIFIGKISEEKIRELESDISETKWFSSQEIENMDVNTLRDSDIKIMIKDYFAGKKYPLELITHTISE